MSRVFIIALALFFFSYHLVGVAIDVALFCPDKFTFVCKKINSAAEPTNCTITTNINVAWNFTAPDRVINQYQLAAFGSGHSSKAALRAGTYQASYIFSYYGPISGLQENSAYCLYSVSSKNYLNTILAGLYSTEFTITKSGGVIFPLWIDKNGKYMCQNAGRCAFQLK